MVVPPSNPASHGRCESGGALAISRVSMSGFRDLVTGISLVVFLVVLYR